MAGLIPGEPMEELGRSWNYTSTHYEEDRKTCHENELRKARGEEPVDTVFMRMREGAYEYARDLMNPDRLNWVRVEFVWL